jgi:hypothetical protein
MSFGVPEPLLDNLNFNLEIRQLVPETLIVNAQLFALLFSVSDFFLEQNSALNTNVVLGLHVLQGRGGIPGLSLVVIVGNLNITQLQLQSTVCVSQRSNFFLQVVLGSIALGFGLLVLGLPQC